MTGICKLGLVTATVALMASVAEPVFGDGPADRRVTDPQSIQSLPQERSVPVKITDITGTVVVSDASVSNDARQITYISNASGRLNVWTMKADGRDARQLVTSDERQATPVFTHDGRTIIYAQDTAGDESYDLYAVPSNGGAATNLTNSKGTSEFNPVFSPNGRVLSFIAKASGSPTPNLGVIAWPSGTERPLTRDVNPKANWTPVCWSPDSRFLYAVRIGSPDDSDVYRIDVMTGAADNLTEHAGHHRVRVSGISPDGKTLLLTSNEKQGYYNVALYDLQSKKTRWFTDTQWEASSGSFSKDGARFFYTLNADGRTRLQFVSMATLESTDRSVPAGLNEAGASNPFLSGDSFLLSHQDSTRPANLYVSSPDGRLKAITHNGSAGLASALVPKSQLVAYKSFDNQLISAFLWVPFNLKRDATAAAVILPHGGPADQATDEFSTLSRRAITLVSRGFVVLAPNVRGSTGYGMAFQEANVKDLGNADLKDEIAGVDFLKATGFVDASKLGIWGGSYGGFMTLMAIGKYPDVFAAAVDEYGILNWSTMLARSEPELQEYIKSLLGDPQADALSYKNSSPLNYMGNVKAPLLVLQGDKDIRVPRSEAEQVVSVLRAAGKTVEAVYYPDEGHVFNKRENRNDELGRASAWFERYLHGLR